MSDRKQFISDSIKWMYDYREYYNNQFDDKDSITLETLNEMSNEMLHEYYIKRLKLRNVIGGDKELYQMMYNECKDNLMTNILFEGVSKDNNRNPKAGIQPIIPYNHQIPLIQSFYSTKNVLTIKSRRQGASLIHGEMMKHNLTFGENLYDFTTHKDLNSLDKKGDTTNTIFGKIRLGLRNSMFISQDIFKNKTDEYRIEDCRIINGTNSLTGSVLSPSTSVGFAVNNGFIDEIAVVEDNYPNSSDYILGAVSTSTNKLYLYSTFRGSKGNFYKTFEEHDDRFYEFITLDWRKHPLCSREWYDKACAMMNMNPVTIAQELDFNPISSVVGQVYSYISENNKVERSKMIQFMSSSKKYIFSDFGGSTSSTVFLLCYWNGQNLYIDDVIKTTVMDELQIKIKIQEKGFWGVKIYGDISGKNQTTTPQSSWFKLLQKVGFTVEGVGNQGMSQYYAKANMNFLNGIYKYNKNIPELKDLENAKWKHNTMEIEKDSCSHIADSLGYGTRVLFPVTSFNTF